MHCRLCHALYSLYLVCCFFVKLTQKSSSFLGESSHVLCMTAVLTCLGSIDCKDGANEISVCVPTFTVVFEADDSVEHICFLAANIFFSLAWTTLNYKSLNNAFSLCYLSAWHNLSHLCSSFCSSFFPLWFLFSLFFSYHSFCLHFYVVKPPKTNNIPHNVFKFAGFMHKIATWHLVKKMMTH